MRQVATLVAKEVRFVFVSGHRKNDRFSLRLHQVIAAKLQADQVPIMRKARDTLEARRDLPNASYYVREWERLLNGPREKLLAVLVEESEYALRHATPFSGIVPPKENWGIHRAVAEEWQHAPR